MSNRGVAVGGGVFFGRCCGLWVRRLVGKCVFRIFSGFLFHVVEKIRGKRVDAALVSIGLMMRINTYER